jgi:hypothetical protein
MERKSQKIVVWWQLQRSTWDNNLSLNVIKTKEMIVDYWKRRTEHAPILVEGAAVEQVESFKFLAVHITNKLEWSKLEWHNKAYSPLRKLKRFVMGPQILKRFYSCNIERTGCITAWYGNCPASDRKARPSTSLGLRCLATRTSYTKRYQRKALKIVKDFSHPSHTLFSLLPHGKRYRSAKSRTKTLHNSFYPQANQMSTRTMHCVPSPPQISLLIYCLPNICWLRA